MAVLLNVIASSVLSVQMHENSGKKLIISSDLGYISNILSLPSIVCADKRDGGFKISSRCFSN